MEKYRYKTTAINNNGSNGFAYIVDGIKVQLAPISVSSTEHTNPEQLLALSWATCLNSTLKYLLKAKNINTQSVVKVDAYLLFDKDNKRFDFALDAFVDIEGLTIEEIEPLMMEADSRCPVSRLFNNNERITIKAKKFI